MACRVARVDEVLERVINWTCSYTKMPIDKSNAIVEPVAFTVDRMSEQAQSIFGQLLWLEL